MLEKFHCTYCESRSRGTIIRFRNNPGYIRVGLFLLRETRKSNAVSDPGFEKGRFNLVRKSDTGGATKIKWVLKTRNVYARSLFSLCVNFDFGKSFSQVSVILRLSREKPVISVGQKRCTRWKPPFDPKTLSHWQLSQMPRTGIESTVLT